MSKKLSYEYIYNEFEKKDCELLEENYKSNKQKLKYKCSCGIISHIRFDHFMRGVRCRDCGIKKVYEAKAFNQEYVNRAFLDAGCECLDVYKNRDIPLKYRCNCGNVSKITFGNFQQGKRCKKCGGNEKLTQGGAEQLFIDGGGELLDKYLNMEIPVQYKCSCGNISKISPKHFKNGHRCKECALIRNSGKNHYLWIEDRSKIRDKELLHNLSEPYKKKFRKKNNISKEYDIDHIMPICAFVHYKIYDLELINGEDNLRPLTPLENGQKSGKYIKEEFENWLISKNIKFQSQLLLEVI